MRDGLVEISARAVEAALAAGAEEAEAWAEQSQHRQIRVYAGEVESLTDAAGQGLGLRAFREGGRVGYAYGTDLTPAGISSLASAASASAEVADADEHAGIPEECGATQIDGLHSAALATWTTDRKVELALAIEGRARGRAGVSQVEEAVYSDAEERIALANSRGFSSAYESTAAWAYVSAFAGEGRELMTGMGLGLGRDPGELDPEAVGDEAADRALALVGARQPSSRRVPVVLDALVAASFLGYIGGTLSAEAVQRGRSLFAGREGEEIAAPAVRLADDGTDPSGLATAPFDGEGSPARSTPLVEDGRLRTFLYDARTAREAGRATTGNARRGSYRSPPSVGTTNLVLEPGDQALSALVASAGEGLYVSDVVGLHSGVNPVSGTFSVGASGRLIEGGELGEPVREVTIASDLVSMLQSVRGIGAEARWVPFGGSIKASPLLLGEMAVSGS